MNGHSGPAPLPNKRVLRTMRGLSLACALAGLAVIIGGFIVLSTSVFDEMNARAHLVIPGEFAVMSDGEFVRSLLPAAGVAGIVHLVGVVAGLMGRTRAEDRRELARCALGVGANAFFLPAPVSPPSLAWSPIRGRSCPSSLCAALRSWLRVCPYSAACVPARARYRWAREPRACWLWPERCLSACSRNSRISLRHWRIHSCLASLSSLSASTRASRWASPS